tara:strand:- start:4613 stop:5719 length:1107 start_codon:yes stop_codon:yes gene_type:complete
MATEVIKLNLLDAVVNFDSVDEETNTLKGIQVINMGVALGHGTYIDRQSIEMLYALAEGTEVKSYFGHPAMCSPRIGTDLGVMSNFALNDTGITADMRMFKAAMKEGGNGVFVMDMAQNDPDHIGNSVEMRIQKEEREEIIDEADFKEGYDFRHSNQKGVEDGQLKVSRFYMRPKVFGATAIVSKGAATNALFSDSFFSDGDLAAKVTSFLDENEDVRTLLASDPNIVKTVTGYLTKYSQIQPSILTKNPDKMADNKEGASLSTEDVANTVESVLAARDQAAKEAAELAEQEATALAAAKAVDDEMKQLKADNEALTLKLAEKEKGEQGSSSEGGEGEDDNLGADSGLDGANISADYASHFDAALKGE